jgi:hypothetical protein
MLLPSQEIDSIANGPFLRETEAILGTVLLPSAFQHYDSKYRINQGGEI